MTERLLTIDGSLGEGGGQVLRSSLTLPLMTGRPFVIEKIRAGRKKPGLLQQHLTAVLAAAEVGGAKVDGAALGSGRAQIKALEKPVSQGGEGYLLFRERLDGLWQCDVRQQRLGVFMLAQGYWDWFRGSRPTASSGIVF